MATQRLARFYQWFEKILANADHGEKLKKYTIPRQVTDFPCQCPHRDEPINYGESQAGVEEFRNTRKQLRRRKGLYFCVDCKEEIKPVMIRYERG